MNTMHRSLLTIAITAGLALTTAASAQGSAATEAGDARAAHAVGEANAYLGEDSGSFHLSRQPWVSTRTRAEVLAELKVAQQRGEVAALTCEDSGSSHFARHGQTGAPRLGYAGPNIGEERAAERSGNAQVAAR
jgi:hypothetical protein